MPNFITKQIQSFGHAFRGIFLLISSERSFQIEMACALGVTALGWYIDISATEWCLQWLAIALVLAAEGLNTAIEQLSDMVQPEKDMRVRNLKDISAGAVAICAIVSLIIAAIIYVPKFL